MYLETVWWLLQLAAGVVAFFSILVGPWAFGMWMMDVWDDWRVTPRSVALWLGVVVLYAFLGPLIPMISHWIRDGRPF